MNDLEFLDEILDDDLTPNPDSLDYVDEIIRQGDFEDIEPLEDCDDCNVLDNEFIESHLIPVNASVIENFPFIEDDIDAITDYELFSKGFGYLEDTKADKEELTEYVKKDEIPPLDSFVTKDTKDLEYYTLSSDLSDVALSGNYNDLNHKPTIPTKTSDLNNDSGFIDKNVNNLTYYTKSSQLASVATSGDYDDLIDKPTIPDVSNFITKDVNDLTYYTLTSSLATVATSGNYNDLSNTPTIPDVSNFITKDVNDLTYYTLTSNLSTVATSGSYTDLSNTPTIPTVPTNVSAFNNDAGYITNAVNDLTNYTTTSSLNTLLSGKEDSINIGSNANGYYIKFSDGTAICWKDYSGTKDINYQIGGGYRSTSIGGGSLPITLLSVSGAWANGQVDFVNENQWAWAVTNNKATTTAFQSMVFLSNYSSTSRSYTAYTFVIGKWK